MKNEKEIQDPTAIIFLPFQLLWNTFTICELLW